jgi:diguanylate cyclase (GGDEF)-like protein/PAS domain S-box-containing protein
MKQSAHKPSNVGAASAEADFKLLRYFSSASLIAFVVVAVLIGVVFRNLSVDNLINSYESEHINHARILANELWDEYVGPLVLTTADTPADQLRKSPELEVLHKKTQALIDGTRIFKVKVYDLKGRTVYSSDLQQVGQDKNKNSGVQAALKGRNSSKLVHRDQISTFEGEIQPRDVIESYIPRYDPATGKVSGVFEIYRDATTVLQEVDRRQTQLVVWAVAMLALLYIVVFAIVKRAQDQLRLQSLKRQAIQRALALSEERWKFALEGSGDGVWDRNLATGKVVFSKRYKEIYGFDPDELQNHDEPWDSRVHPDDLAQVMAAREAYFKDPSLNYVSERRMQCKDGTWKWILSRGMVVSYDANGKPVRMIGTHTDITERHEREQDSKLAATVLQTMDEAVAVTDAQANIISVNPAFTTITGYSAEEVLGQNPRLLTSGSHSKAFFQNMWQQLQTLGSWQGEICNRRKSGRSYFEWLSIKRVTDAKGTVTHYVAVFSDISARKANEQKLKHLAHFDPLTELPNRSLFADRLHQGIAQSQREHKQMALMFVDLDNFKPVNDALGHAVGDLLLKAVAQRLIKCLQRDSDTVARIGGDEFVVLMLEMSRSHDAMEVAAKICKALAQPYELEQNIILISASIGVSIYPDHGRDSATLMNHADAAMYHAKAGGRNQVMLFNTELDTQQSMERHLDDLPSLWQSL